eukprot:TRINITY_DN6455_c0_g1_i2.p1 TRINITY_DN6455_c0_g1~~TRINITY_DN6455_c0_g1_i2.p1  ORF type:complete len:104 (+),score=15.43 TRINITY_DN6455_c0_g1_i2:343-654(+)
MAVTENGDLYTWGHGMFGELGHGSYKSTYVPSKLESLQNVTAIACSYHSMAVKENGELFVWGYGANGQIGNGKEIDICHPEKILSHVVSIGCGCAHSMAITSA